MPVFTFRLQPLLDQKLELEKQARLQAMDRQRALEEARHILGERRARHEQIRTKLKHVEAHILDASNAAVDAQRRDNYREGLATDAEEARQAALAQEFAVEEAELELKRARMHWAHCTREVEKLEKFRDKRRARFEADLQRKEQQEQEETGTAMHLSRRSEA